MRIGVTCHHTYGGSGTVATELGMALAKRGHDVHFICLAEPYRLRLNSHIYFHQVGTVEYPLFEQTPTVLSLASKMGETIATEKLQLLHVHYAIPHATAAYLARQLDPGSGIKVITTLHGTDITLVGQDPSYFSMTKFSIEQSDRITAVSNWLKDQTIKEFGITAPIDVIYNSVDAERFHRAESSECSRPRYAPEGQPIIMHISNFRPVKRTDDVIRTFAAIRAHMPAKLLMIGDGPQRMPAQEAATRLGVMDDTWFLGRQDQVEAFLSLADLFLFPSEHESFGLAALEAMACGVPVVGSRAGGLPEVVTDDETGYLCEVGNVECMAARALDILSDRERAGRMRDACVDRAVTDFASADIVEQYERLYEEALAG